MGTVKRGKSMIPIDLLQREPRLNKPKADDLYRVFAEFCAYAEEKGLIPDKFLWVAYLGVPKDTYATWDKDNRNKYLSDTEFNDRAIAIKKIEDVLEAGMAQTLMAQQGNAGNFIFYLKNAFKWADRQEPEVSLNLNVDGYKPPQPRSDNRPIETNIETSDRKPLQ